MGKLLQARVSVIFFAILIVIFGFNWFTGEKSRSFSEPHEAILDLDQNLIVIPAYKKNNVSLNFFIKDNNKFGATFVEHGIFGWKTHGNLLYNDIGKFADYETLEPYRVHDEYFVYGLIHAKEEPQILVNSNEAVLINIETVDNPKIKELKMDNMYIWYLESSMPIPDGKLELKDKASGDLISTTKLDMKKE
ncbi:hypothetical protein [Bacillus marasmi]|uniref:hypothetical protein n=1 Tax=Bacillus marasmi TaxID=1926279 RepID=UPI0011C80307|nr:hypothetical protein [Bacillus marasmi]